MITKPQSEHKWLELLIGDCTIEIIDADHWLFNSELQAEDGSWVQFMSGKHTRS